MQIRTPATAVLVLLCLCGCTLTRPAPFTAQPAGTMSPPATVVPPAAGTAAGQPAQATEVPVERPAPPAPRQFRLSAASGALVAQAHTQAAGGDYGQAAATLERAQRIEPDNPLLWIELGRVRLAENDASQADAMGRKALSLATGDPGAQAQAWHLISDSLRARGRNGEAAEADQKALGLAPR